MRSAGNHHFNTLSSFSRNPGAIFPILVHICSVTFAATVGPGATPHSLASLRCSLSSRAALFCCSCMSSLFNGSPLLLEKCPF